MHLIFSPKIEKSFCEKDSSISHAKYGCEVLFFMPKCWVLDGCLTPFISHDLDHDFGLKKG